MDPQVKDFRAVCLTPKQPSTATQYESAVLVLLQVTTSFSAATNLQAEAEHRLSDGPAYECPRDQGDGHQPPGERQRLPALLLVGEGLVSHGVLGAGLVRVKRTIDGLHATQGSQGSTVQAAKSTSRAFNEGALQQAGVVAKSACNTLSVSVFASHSLSICVTLSACLSLFLSHPHTCTRALQRRYYDAYPRGVINQQH